MQVKFRLERDIFHGHETGAIEVQAKERYLIVMQRVHLKLRLDRERYLIVMPREQSRYTLEKVISDYHATGVIEVQAVKIYIL